MPELGEQASPANNIPSPSVSSVKSVPIYPNQNSTVISSSYLSNKTINKTTNKNTNLYNEIELMQSKILKRLNTPLTK